MSFLAHFSNWQSHLFHFLLTLFVSLWYQPSFDFSHGLIEIFSGLLWILLFSLCSLKGFIILHDCAHNSFFLDNDNNEFLGRLLSIFVITPYCFWQKAHNKHHAIQGRSDKLDLSATIHFTVDDVKNIKNKYLRLLYIIYRIPIIFYTFTPFLIWWLYFPYICILQNDYLPIFGHFIRILIIYLFAPSSFTFYFCFKLYCITSYIPGFLGVILFHIQHSHNPSYRKSKNDGFNRIDASIDGSYCHKVPFILKLFTMGIEYHSIHHFDTAIPGYSLEYYYNTTHHDNNLKYKINKKQQEYKIFDKRINKIKVINYNDIYHCMFNIVHDQITDRYITWSQCVKQIYFT